jgi:hypothetical protein
MKIFAEIPSVKVCIGGEPHTGWLPSGVAEPLPTPVRELDLKLTIFDNEGDGCVFEWESADGTYRGDTWHQTLEEAKRAARDWFGIAENAWTLP